ncbi:MAG: hypothetical protein HY671_10505 [Chloroflexi bacterium]|nr:hypothetical protein [Chloroflexota bacterium]
MKNRANRTVAVDKLDSKPYSDKVRRTGELAYKTLASYGEPTMTLSQLRAALDQQLGDVSLSDFVIKERQAGR